VGQRPTLTYIFHRKDAKVYRKVRKKHPPCPLQRGNCKVRKENLDNLENLTKITVQTNKKAALFLNSLVFISVFLKTEN